MSGYYGQSMQKYTAFQVVAAPVYGSCEDAASLSDIVAVEAFGDNVLAMSKRQIRLQYRSGIPKHTIT